MEQRQESSGEPPYSPRMEPDTPDSLNNACLLDDSDFFLEEPVLSQDFSSTIVPETPSPVTYRRKRHNQKDEDKTVATSSCSYGRNWERPEHIPGYLSTTPSSQRTMKRRKLENSNANHSNIVPHTNGFVTASSLLPTNFTWLESPHPAASSASSKPSSSAGSSTYALDQTSDSASLNELLAMGHTTMQKTLNTSKGREKRPKKNRTKTSKSSTHTSLSAIEDEALLLDSARRIHGPAGSPVCLIPEDVVVIEDDGDGVMMENVVRSVQMAEDEAYARSLQEQFDMEERIEQQQREYSRSQSSNNHNHMVNPYMGLGCISPWASMIDPSSFAPELQQVIFGEHPRRQQGQRQTGRTRNSRRRPVSQLQMDMFDDSQGNNYEALLAFEEQQGAVMGKNALTKAEIERLPIKTYNPTNSAGKTDCQICFSEYKAGERLRMLPCLHDYHVKCIDRWLKENGTCPICRADVSECGGFP